MIDEERAKANEVDEEHEENGDETDHDVTRGHALCSTGFGPASDSLLNRAATLVSLA
jgi:hypothetical protein